MKDFLKNISIFSQLTDEELNFILPLCKEIEVKKGEFLFREDEDADKLYLVKKGKISVQFPCGQKMTSDEEIVVHIAKENDVVGISAILENADFASSAKCKTDCELVVIDGVKLRNLLANNHEIGYKVLSEMIKLFSSRLWDTKTQLISVICRWT